MNATSPVPNMPTVVQIQRIPPPGVGYDTFTNGPIYPTNNTSYPGGVLPQSQPQPIYTQNNNNLPYSSTHDVYQTNNNNNNVVLTTNNNNCGQFYPITPQQQNDFITNIPPPHHHHHHQNQTANNQCVENNNKRSNWDNIVVSFDLIITHLLVFRFMLRINRHK